jgi:hypothetical protein
MQIGGSVPDGGSCKASNSTTPAHNAPQTPGFKHASDRSSENARHHLLTFIVRVSHGAFTRNYQGVSHAKWLQNHHECAPTQSGRICKILR